MRLKKAIFILWGFFVFSASVQAEEFSPFLGVLDSDGINLRQDSTTNSAVICAVGRQDNLEVTGELYDWYKVRLPKTCPAYINKDLVEIIEAPPSISPTASTAISELPVKKPCAKVLKERVNIRLAADSLAAIIGKADKLEVVNIIGQQGQWYKILPTNNTFGWVHKKFVKKIEKKEPGAQVVSEDKQNSLVIEGLIEPYGRVFLRTATHKLVTADKKTYLLQAEKEKLLKLNGRRVKITGSLVEAGKQNFPLVAVEKIEVLE